MNKPFTLNKIVMATLLVSLGNLTACSSDMTQNSEKPAAELNANKIWPHSTVGMVLKTTVINTC